MHFPVMLRESIEYLAVRPEGVFLDATSGLGGHTQALAERITTGFVIACDRDSESLERAKRNLEGVKDRVRFYHGPFSTLDMALAMFHVEHVDGILADLGVSRYQLTDPERGFSLMADGPLDMRLDRSSGEPASDLVNFTAEKALADLIYRFGEERRSRRIARAIVRARPVHTTLQLARVIEQAVGRTGRLHPATQTFMALRLAVNDEPGELNRFLDLAPRLVMPGGRIVMITFMSLEDRAVKRKFQALAQSGAATLLTRHVVRPDSREIEENPPSRSAKLRALQMTGGMGKEQTRRE